MTLMRLIITGANGSGKTHFARQLTERRPDLEVITYDALRLKQNWVKRPQAETTQTLMAIVERNAWILEGGPSLLHLALHRCQGVIWLDRPERIRAWRLAIRPWQNLGRVRPELPDGNVDWPLHQYAFALNSLRKGRASRQAIKTMLNAAPPANIWHCTSKRDVDAALDHVATRMPKRP